MTLKKYKAKRDFTKTPEPLKSPHSIKDAPRFVVQKHDARHLHYDFRLEYKGVLLSWAVPKGPSLNPHDKRLAIKVEDHPLDYQYFEGVIPKGNYGAGTVEIWDKGTFHTYDSLAKKDIEKYLQEGLKKGHFNVLLDGEKLKGEFVFQKLKPEDESWLLFKKKDSFASDEPILTPKKMELTHEDKIYWPEEGYTKGDLLTYYEKIAPFILPYLKNRPITLHRYPEGIEGQHFYQKDLPVGHPNWIKTCEIQQEKKLNHYLLIHDVKSLLYAVNLGSIDIHPLIARCNNLEHPDYTVIDIDPHDISFDKVIEAALLFHELLEKIDVPHFCKTSGGKGLHIFIPLKGKYDFEQSGRFAEILSTLVHEQLPKTTSLERATKKREKKIYLDCLQNRKAQTIVAPYSVRPRPHALVSTPLSWKEVNLKLNPGQFDMFSVPKRLDKVGDLFSPILKQGVNLIKALKDISKVIK